MKNKKLKEETSSEIKILILLYFVAALAEVIAEFFNYKAFIYFLKPFLIPILTIIYWKSSGKPNVLFIIAMFFALMANVFFIASGFDSIVIGAVFFMLYRIIVLYLVLKILRVANYFPVFLASIPFICIFLYLSCLTFNELGNALFIYIVQVIFMSFLGGLSLSSYIMNDSKRNYWLLLSSVLFALIQFILVLKVYYISISIFQPFAMTLYVFAQYALYKFMISSENLDDNTSFSV
ncbi:lysoplasmalogenase family protein [Flavobacterium sp.]|uniref:lysoplasmalogenase family protein n=1 Tax=Flavobacterium sp. TaxID=239 RepID=UPI002602D8D1|nr:lysoplasmalogenase family protein [Flavobacterium sp.]